MNFRETPLAGAFVVDIEPHVDERGFFARTWCSQEFAAQGLEHGLVQVSISRNARRGTLRGMHLQLAAVAGSEAGAVHARLHLRCDHRPSPGVADVPAALRARAAGASDNALYIPPLVAHGFQTLEDDTEVLYQMTDFYAPELAFGVRWNDPAFAIRWPIAGAITIIGRDRDYADFDPGAFDRAGAKGA